MLEKGNGHPTQMEMSLGFPLVAVAVDKNKGSQSALQWAVSNLVLKGQIYCKDVVLGGQDVAKAITEFVSHAAIEKMVVGASSKSAFVRRFTGHDITGNIIKKAPNFCSVYVIAKGKLSSTRVALLPAPANSPFRDQILTDASFKPDTFGCFSRASSDLLREMAWAGQSPRHDESIRSRPSNANSQTDHSLTDSVAYFAWSDADSRSSSVSSARPSCALPSRASNASEGFDHDFDRITTPCRKLSSCGLTGPAFGWIEHESDGIMALSSPTAMEGMEEEVKRLKQQLEQTMDMYNRACKEAVAAKQKAAELQSWRSEEEKRVEAQTIEDAAIELEAQRKYLLERKLKEEVEDKRRELYSLSQLDIRYRRFSMEEIEIATESFAESLKIGEGGYGPVYKCYLDHTKVAVKVLRSNATQDQAEFQQEIEFVSCIRHPNIVLLLGACPEHRCLVYEYMANGSLEDRLFRRGNMPAIPWQFRFIIAAEIATGLLFLHRMKPEPIVYRALKPGSILLDKYYVSKISDVGLARLVPTSSVSGDVTPSESTFCCYIDPEYLQTGPPAVESDIYSLGVVLMQILTAKPPDGLTQLLRLSIEEDKFARVLDPAVPDWPVKEARNLAEIALKCTETQRIGRPDLETTVMLELKRLRDLAEDSMLCKDNFSDSVWTPSGSESSRTNSSGSWAT
ncbi:U-box domain-containing protein 52-like [Zingiber officinale]|uniref:U-box domain-containing protein 52-like n=1 Tax=Zingiber officinale TaxID=94328 RepID=UPI001C4B2390|nr:U-box domain-containing protein 52-like [Zingiber officinale]